jgi:hypothetical protein
MTRPAPDLCAYVESVCGMPMAFDERLLQVEARLSLALRERYHLEAVRLFGHRLVLAVHAEHVDPGTPSAYAVHVAAIAQLVEVPVVLVLGGVTSATRARLIAAGVPFIVPGSQMFLPMLLVDLRERMARPAARREAPLGSVAQLVILTHLQRQRLDELSLAEVAAILGYSSMMLTKAKDELVAAELCTVRPAGRALRLAFPEEGRLLWERALPRLSSPVRRRHWVKFRGPSGGIESCGSPAAPAVRAGVSALSDVTDLADDAVVTLAVSKSSFTGDDVTFEEVEFEDDADALFEVWRYAPEALASNGRVDPLSLYLSLRGAADERVQATLEDLLEAVRW